MTRLESWALSILLLIGVLICLFILFVVALSTWTGTKLWVWRYRRKRAWRELYRAKYRADGTPLPPASRGVCEACGKVFDKVYHLPNGQRLCPECYEASDESRPS